MQSVFVVCGSHETIPDIHDMVDSFMDQNRVTILLLLLLCYYC